jgi:hypothetical protein
VVPLQAHYAGLTYAEWAVRWWQWEARTSTLNSPALDSTGEHVAEGQSGPVWFLTWSFTSDSVVRSATIPVGTALLFPATNSEPYFFLPPDATLEERLATAELVFVQTVEHHAEVDGVPINDMDSYRVVSPPYVFTLPEDNIVGVSGGDYGPSINAGYYYLVKPLSVGEHTIHFYFSVQNTFFGDFAQDITYHLTVSPHY